MTKPRGVAAEEGQAAAVTADTPATAATRDLVGWALQSPLRHEGALTDKVARRVLATALDVDERTLTALDSGALHTALDRLRGLVAYCDRLAAEAMTDDLTGALRRGSGIKALRRELDRVRRTGDTGIVVAFFDVDGLKAVNDTDGHAAGDQLLRAVVAAIQARIRSYDLVFRYGGDEFVCVLVGVTLAQAQRTVGDIREKVGRKTPGHSVSVGIAEATADDTPEAVIGRADAALYRDRAAAG